MIYKVNFVRKVPKFYAPLEIVCVFFLSFVYLNVYLIMVYFIAHISYYYLFDIM